MKIHCDACDGECQVEFIGLVEIGDALPKHWRHRIIDHQAYILCGVCGHPRQVLGGPSPYLQDALGLSANAHCEVPERTDFF